MALTSVAAVAAHSYRMRQAAGRLRDRRAAMVARAPPTRGCGTV